MADAPRGCAREGWPQALALVGCVYLLTMAGSWLVTDLGETLFAARRLLDRGTLELARPGEAVPQLPWLSPAPDRPLRSRLAPLTPYTLAPLLALDRLFGWEDPRPDGRLVHLQGLLATLAGLALLGRALRRGGASPRAAAVAVAVTGLAWPVWRASRRAGPEALLILLVSLFVSSRSAAGSSARDRWLAALACFALPWAHPTGAIVAASLTLTVALEDGESLAARLRAAGPTALATATGTASWMLIWNLGYHGDLLQGGYAPYAPAGGFVRLDPLAGLAENVGTLLPQVGLLVALALLGTAASRPPRRGVAAPVLLTTALLGFFSTFYSPEPERRLACVWPAWGALLGRSWAPLDRGPWTAGLLVAANGLLSFRWFMREEGRFLLGPGGLYYPSVLWVELLLDGHPPWLVAAPVALLLVGLWLAARALVRAPGVAAATTPNKIVP